MMVGDIVAEPLRLHRIGPRAGPPDRVAERSARWACGPKCPPVSRTSSPAANASGSASPGRCLRTNAARRRRTHHRPRRVGAGLGAQPPRRPATRPRVRLPVHHPRPGRGGVPGRRLAVMYLGQLVEEAARADLSRARATRTPRRCWRPRRWPTRSANGSGNRCCPATTCRPRSIRRPAAASTPGARSRSPRCATECTAAASGRAGRRPGRLPPGQRRRHRPALAAAR